MFSQIQYLFSVDGIISLLIALPCVLLSLTFHEVSHGWVAHKLGDDTALSFGRLTLNPLKHLDPIGTVCMVLFGFGWAKPVPVNTRNLRKPKRDMALVAAAGPASNLLLGFIGAILVEVYMVILSHMTIGIGAYRIVTIIYQLLYTFHYLNLSLAVFNLIPLPPLDGSRIAYIFLPSKWYFAVMKYEQYIKLAFLLLLWTGAVSLPLGNIVGSISGGMFWVIDKVVGIFI